jgi:trimeric autotransporter adhesin
MWGNFITLTFYFKILQYQSKIINMKNILILTLLLFLSFRMSAQQEIMLLKSSGKVVIGDTSQIKTPGEYNLYVQRGILTERVKVSLKTAEAWSDDEFKNTPKIKDVKESIEKSSHLIDMPSAESLVKTGYDITNMDSKLLMQIEWLWQHMIKLQEENIELKRRILKLEKK